MGGGGPASAIHALTDGLAPDRAAAFLHARSLVDASLPNSYVEGLADKMVTWTIRL